MESTPNQKKVAGVVIFRREEKDQKDGTNIKYLMLTPRNSDTEYSPPKGQLHNVYDKDCYLILKCAEGFTYEKTRLKRNEHYDILEISDSFDQIMTSDPSGFKKVTFFLGELRAGRESDLKTQSQLPPQWLDKELTKTLYREQNGIRRIVDHHKFDGMMNRFEAFIIANKM